MTPRKTHIEIDGVKIPAMVVKSSVCMGKDGFIVVVKECEVLVLGGMTS